MPPAKRFAPLLFITLLLALPALSSATTDAGDPPPSRSGRPQRPPPEFATACEGKQVGETVVINTPARREHRGHLRAARQQTNGQTDQSAVSTGKRGSLSPL